MTISTLNKMAANRANDDIFRKKSVSPDALKKTVSKLASDDDVPGPIGAQYDQANVPDKKGTDSNKPNLFERTFWKLLDTGENTSYMTRYDVHKQLEADRKAAEANEKATRRENELHDRKYNTENAPTRNLDKGFPTATYNRHPALKQNVENTVGRLAGMPRAEIISNKKSRESMQGDLKDFIGNLGKSKTVTEAVNSEVIMQSSGRFNDSVKRGTNVADAELKASAFNEPVPARLLGEQPKPTPN